MEKLRESLFDYHALQAKLDATNIQTLIADCRKFPPDDEAIYLLKSALTQSAHILDPHKDQLPYQIVGRLWKYRHKPDLQGLWKQCHRITPLEIIETQTAPPMRQAINIAPLRLLKAHGGAIEGMLELLNKRLLSWSWRGTLLSTTDGQVIATSNNLIWQAVELDNGNLFIWAKDNTLQLWDENGEPIAVLSDHPDRIAGILAIHGGRFLSWSWMGTLCLWEDDGKSFIPLIGHTGKINAVIVLQDQCFLSCGSDGIIHLWADNGQHLATLNGHTDKVISALELRDGRLLSWSRDRTLRLWTADGHPITALTGHTKKINGALELPDGRLLSWSRDQTLRLWGVDGEPLKVLEGHQAVIWGAVALRDGRILSWDRNRADTLHLWDANGHLLNKPRWKLLSTTDPLMLRDDHLITPIHDLMLSLFDENQQVIPLASHPAGIIGIIPLKNNLFLSWSSDRHQLWNQNGQELPLSDIEEELPHLPPAFNWESSRLTVNHAGQFIGDAKFSQPIISGNTIMIGDEVGRVIFLRIRKHYPSST